ncbi:MAG: hypothetical protein Q7J05_03925 [Paludibacter sp.]|nr:hypothetical protein [Paludibacter sp.]
MKKVYSLLIIACLLAGQSMAQSLLEWNFFGSAGTAVSYNSTFDYVELQTATLTRGAGAPVGNGASNAFVGRLAVSSDLAQAITNNAYYEFIIQANTASSISLFYIDAIIRTQLESAKTYQWMYSVDGGAFVAIGSPVTVAPAEVDVNNGVAQARIDLSGIAALQQVASSSTVSVRIYAWGGVNNTSSTANFGFGKSASLGAMPAIIIGGTTNNLSPVSSWNFGTFNAETTAASVAPATVDVNLESVLLSRGEGLTNATLTYGYASFSDNLSTTKAEAITNNEYYEISLKAKTGYMVSIDRFDYKYRRFSTGDKNARWAYSIDGSAYTEIGAEDIALIQNSSPGADYMLDVSTIQDLQNVKAPKMIRLRMYVWGTTNPDVVNGFGVGYAGVTNNLVLKGTAEIDLSSRALSALEEGKSIKVFAAENKITLYVSQPVSKNTSMRIMDITGKTLLSEHIELQSGENKLSFPINLANGVYVLSIDGQQVKFLK